MPSTIQQQARGLLSIITGRSDGVGPSLLLDEARAVLDATKLWSSYRRTAASTTILQGTITAGGVGIYVTPDTADVRPPAGQCFLLHQLAAYVRADTPCTGTNFRFTIGFVSELDATRFIALGPSSNNSTTGGLGSSAAILGSGPILQTPHERPAILVESSSANAGSIEICSLFDRLRA